VSTSATSIDDVQCDISRLYHLLDTVATGLTGMPRTKPDGSRNKELDCTTALVWIARAMAERASTDLLEDFEALDAAKAETRS
jgi:hypothetical protein